ncbi:Palmitoylated plasma membrane-bound casein kinase, partial [Coemansia sp. RSA 2706]
MVVRQNKAPHTSPNIVGVHYRVGKRIGEGSFGVIYEGFGALRALSDFTILVLTLALQIGTNLITNKLVAIKFV